MEDFSRVSVLLVVPLLNFFPRISRCIADYDPWMFSSHVTYQLEIQTSEQITNAIFSISLPVKNHIRKEGMIVLNKSHFEKNIFSVDLVQTPPDRNLTGTSPVQKYRRWFLKINAGRINPEKTQNAAYKIFSDNLTSPQASPTCAGIVYAINNESVFPQKMGFTSLDPQKIPSGFSDRIEYSPIEVPHRIPIYAEYSVSPSPEVKKFSSNHGYNSWKASYDYGGGDSCGDYNEWNYGGESHSWQTAQGTDKAAQGVYPNLDHPDGQMVLNRSVYSSQW